MNEVDSKTWNVKFAYSGSKQRKFFTIDFEVVSGENVDEKIKDYVSYQNKGEAKSDRIRYWSKSIKNKKTKKMKTFQKNRFKEPPFAPVDELLGYTKCLQDLLNYLEEVTEFNPKKRMIDSLPILDMIAESNKELSEILTKERENLNELIKNF